MTKKKCPYCGYSWLVRTENPKECPSCKRYLVKKPKINKVKKEGGEK